MNTKDFKELIDEKKFSEVKKIYMDMNAYDISVLIEDLDMNTLKQAFRLLPKDIASDVFVNLDYEKQQDLILSLTSKEATDIIEDMYSDDAADLFEEMSASVVQKMLSKVDKSVRDDINTLLKYSKNSAGSLMTVEYIHLKKGLTIKESIDRIRKQADEIVSFDNCFVTDGKRKLLGSVTVKDLLINNPYKLVDEIMEECEHQISTSMDQEDVVKVFQDYNYNALPVVDSEGLLVGIITIDDVMDIMEQEASEDMKKMAAIIPIEKSYDKITVFETFKSRIPWLLLLMVSATFTGSIIQGFEKSLEACAVLTAFIPMLMDTGGNAGGQASVSIIRALSLNDIEFKDIFKVIWKEVRVAFLCAIVLAICNFIKLIIFDLAEKADKIQIALTVCTTMVLTVVIAKFIGCTLPMIAKRLGFDPAVMASPFITTIVDACSLLIYFRVACLILGI